MMIEQNETINALIDWVQTSGMHAVCSGVKTSDAAYVVARLWASAPGPLVVVTASAQEQKRFVTDLNFFAGAGIDCWSFPAYNLRPFHSLTYHIEIAAQRIETLYRMTSHGGRWMAVTAASTLIQRVIPKSALTDFAELVMVGEDIDRDVLVGKLLAGGYSQSALVEETGDFAVRGGIVDVYPPLYDDPLRIELFGDQVESVRQFSPVTQRQTRDLNEAVILPAREVVLETDRLPVIINRIRKQAAELGLPAQPVRELVEKIRNQGAFAGIESLLPWLYEACDTFFDYLPPSAMMVLVGDGQVRAAVNRAWEEGCQRRAAAVAAGQVCVAPRQLLADPDEVGRHLASRRTLRFADLALSGPDQMTPAADVIPFAFDIQDNTEVRQAIAQPYDRDNLLGPLVDWIASQHGAGRAPAIVARASAQADRIDALLKPHGIQVRPTTDFQTLMAAQRDRGHHVYLIIGDLSSGFVWPAQQLALISDSDIFGARMPRRPRARRSAKARLLAFDELQTGDFVVHIDHGIGRYDGLVKLTIDGVSNDFLLIGYRDDDRLYLPVERMRLLQKYAGMDTASPALDKMGGKSWERVKGKVKKSVIKMANELLALYAARRVKAGHAFSPVDAYFKEFEAGFAYDETPDQLNAIADVLADMQAAVPMDRLVCGDVGYGKTEVALRAAFKAVCDGRQVALLAPTTVLAEQHLATFGQRFEKYPVTIACLSRFRSPAQQKRILADLAAGKLDIVIGTHRLLQKDVIFKSLGLLVLDEEQRFGVRHKEMIKNMRQTVDVLTLTATPIPRTLHMSLTGVRDISIIATPPEQRQPIVTYVAEFDEAVTIEAIRAELNRQGQIFFIHNNTNTIWSMAEKLARMVPEVRLDVAHGQMKAHELERVMMKFMNRSIDMLVCTTIVESGLDIATANTMIVNRADRFGLAQMYQLRGRVGRSGEQAYAYLFVPRDAALGQKARKRLKVLMEHSDLGSGFQIALNDLKIRGGGSILGASQSGHIAAVGYEMYLELMEKAMAEVRGQPMVEPLDPEINLALSALLPESYIDDIDQRLRAYRRLASMQDLKEIADFKTELTDRFGALPAEAGNLLLKIMLKVLAAQAGVKRLDLNGAQLTLHFSPLHQRQPTRLATMVMNDPKRYRLTPDNVLKISLGGKGRAGLMQTKNILKEIDRHVNS